jgi:hypothetical protein
LEIVITVCALLSTAQCEEKRIGLDPEAKVTPATCMMQAMPMVAQWAGEHPKWVVKRWRCGERRKEGWPI